MLLFENNLTNSYLLFGGIVACYGPAQALSHAYLGKVYDRRMVASSRGSDLEKIWT